LSGQRAMNGEFTGEDSVVSIAVGM
jgi:hypothetical protein